MRKLLSLVLLFCLMACQSESGKQGVPTLPKKVELITPSGKVIETTLAITPAEQEQGLSGVQPQDFDDDDGMLFYYLQDDEKHFWMPDTYFDLDIIFLDKELKILDIIRKLPFYVGRSSPELIPRARGVWARHALEMKATSEISKELKAGDILKLKADVTLEQLEEMIKKPAP